MTRSSRALPLLLAALTVTTAACRRQAIEPAVPPVENTSPVSGVDSAAILDSIARARRLAEEEEARRNAVSGSDRERRMAEVRAALLAPVYFEYNQSELAEDARMTLDAKVPVLLANPAIRLRIGGHTDSRGSDEYNLTLGQRRAAMVREYLTARGVDAARLEIISFGEEMPAVPGEYEGAWAQNRRAEFEVIAGEITNVGENR